MPLGEKLFEDTNKTTANTIKSVGPEGVTIEVSWMGDVKGVGRLSGVTGKSMASGTYTQGPNGIAAGHSQGILTTAQGDMVVWKINGTGRNDPSGGNFIGMLTFMTTSQRLAWLNGVIAVYEGRGPLGTRSGPAPLTSGSESSVPLPLFLVVQTPVFEALRILIKHLIFSANHSLCELPYLPKRKRLRLDCPSGEMFIPLWILE